MPLTGMISSLSGYLLVRRADTSRKSVQEIHNVAIDASEVELDIVALPDFEMLRLPDCGECVFLDMGSPSHLWDRVDRSLPPVAPSRNPFRDSTADCSSN